MSNFTRFMRWFTGEPLGDPEEEMSAGATEGKTPTASAPIEATTAAPPTDFSRPAEELTETDSGDSAQEESAGTPSVSPATATSPADQTPHMGTIQGAIEGGGGLLLHLLLEDELVAQGKLGESGQFRLRNLAAGRYQVRIVNPDSVLPVVESEPISIDGTETIQLLLHTTGTEPADPPSSASDFLPAPVFSSMDPSPTDEQEREASEADDGPPDDPDLENPEMASPEIVSPEMDDKGSTDLGQSPESVKAKPSALAPQPSLAEAGVSLGLDHYVLFGPPHQVTTRMYLLLLLDALLAANVTFGCRSQDAAQARRVTVIGSPQEVPDAILQPLQAKGVQVQRIQGTPEEMVRRAEQGL